MGDLFEMAQAAADWLCGNRAEPMPADEQPYGKLSDSALPSAEEIQRTLNKPRRKGLGPKQLRWLRTNIEPFKDMEARALAAKGIVGKVGK